MTNDTAKLTDEKLVSSSSSPSPSSSSSSKLRKRDLNWPAVLFYLHLNVFGAYGLYNLFTNTSIATTLFTFMLTLLGFLGVTAGAHRLWAHQTYTATKSLSIFLMLCQTLVGQGSIYNWVQKHRLHHQEFRKPDDPYFSTVNFISAHVYAQVLNLSPEQERLLEKVDMSDLEKDGVVMFQKKFYWILFFVLHVLLPVNTPLEYWGDSIAAAVFVVFSLRYLIILNLSWLINSAHFIWGLDKNFKASESNSVFFITKSYWPYFHYLMPNDYQSGEFGNYSSGFTSAAIRIFATLDFASDLHTVSSMAVKNGITTAIKTGRHIVMCVKEEAAKYEELIPKNHFINRNKFL